MKQLKYKAIILDDNHDNADLLQHLLETYCEEIELVKVFHDPMDVLAELPSINPDILFVDIVMTELNGLDLLDALPEGFAERTVFVTGHQHYAIDAIKKRVFDYLLKPVSALSLRETVKRFVSHASRQQAHVQPEKLSNHILINRHDKALLLNLDDINYIEAQGSYTRVVCSRNDVIQSTKPIAYFKDLMAPHSRFLQANQSYLINVTNIKEIEKETGRDAVLVFKDGSSLLLMRRTKDNLINLIKEYEKR